MLDKLTGKQIHYWIHFTALAGIAAGLPWSKIPLSLGTMLLGLNLILKWDWKTCWTNWRTNPWLLLFFAYVFLEWLSICWTHDISAALEDLRTKIPLYSIPLSVVALPMRERKHIHWIVGVFLMVVLITSLFNYGSYVHWWGDRVYDDIRGLSLFISHIRYSLMVILAIVFLAGWFIRRYRFYQLTFIPVAWLLYYTYFSQVGTGYYVLAGVVMLLVFFKFRSIQHLLLRRLLSLVVLLGIIGAIVFVYFEIRPVEHKVKLTADLFGGKTVNGTVYRNDSPGRMIWENGYPVQVYMAETELAKEWNKASDYDYWGTDLKGNDIRWLVMRYMTSKGLRKDSVDFHKLTREDIHFIESGIGSVELTRGGIFSQLYRVRKQLQYNEDPSGQSLLERLEYVRAGLRIIGEHPLFGVGLGDIKPAFDQMYEETHSKLRPESRHTTHNQYLTTWITSGVFGFIAFLLWWGVFFASGMKRKAVEWSCFALICILSFLNEDTLETQTGLTFVAFFFGLSISHANLFYRSERSIGKVN